MRSDRFKNLITAIRRTERKLNNSMAHTPRPRPADVERWQGIAADLAIMKRAAAARWPGRYPEWEADDAVTG